MKVKRWLLVAAIAALLLGMGLLLVAGKGFVGQLYEVLAVNQVYYYLLASVAILTGILGIVWGLNRAAWSLLSGVTGEARSSPEIIWQKRFLSKGPRVAVIGGGTGLSVLLRGLKRYTSNISAVVTVMDDGGSSGRLRQEMNMLPPGDIRNCLIALADNESQMSQLFDHRFGGGGELAGHSLGNLFIAGMERLTGSFDRGIEETSKLLNVRGEVIPATLTNTDLVAELSTGEQIRGESSIADHAGDLVRLKLAEEATPHPKALEALRNAQIIILGPGSLYTSLIPNLLVNDLAAAIENAQATKFFIVNLMTEPGETDSFSASDHLRALEPYLATDCLDWIVVNTGQINKDILDQYSQEGADQVEPDLLSDPEWQDRVISDDLIQVLLMEGKKTIKHDDERLTKLILSH